MMEVITRGSFLITKFKEKGLTIGSKIKHIQANGRITRCMEKEKLYGKMAQFIRENIKTTKSTVQEFSFGLMVENT
jgi:hypothetical protein